MPLNSPQQSEQPVVTNTGSETTPAPAFRNDPWALAAVVVFVVAALRFFTYSEDDVFITMRYAVNFWHGHGFVMNPGEHVEGYTSPLQLWYLTALLGVMTGDHVVFVTKILDIAAGIVVMRQARALARVLFPSPAWTWRALPLLLAVQPTFILSMINALETPFATAILITGVLTATVEIEENRPTLLRSALWFSAAALARPELALTFPLIWVTLAVRRRRVDTLSIAAYAIPLIALLIWRKSFYGEWLPNTYYAKHMKLGVAFSFGIDYIRNYVTIGMPVLWWGVLLAGLAGAVTRARFRFLPCAATLVLHMLFLLRSGGDWMMDGRFATIIMPYLLIVLTCGIDAVWRTRLWLGRRADPRFAAAAAGVIIGFCALTMAVDTARSAGIVLRMGFIRGIDAYLAPHEPYAEWMGSNGAGRLALAHWIGDHVRPGQTVLIEEMGIVTLANPSINFIDVNGLTDAHIARMTGYPRGRGGVGDAHMWMNPPGDLSRYIRRRRPEWVALLWAFDRSKMAGSTDSNDLFAPYAAFTVHFDGHPVYVVVWKRRDVGA
ncbi:MAG: hypothetical protein ACLQVD_09735 [Capsulimonadaceae bacterium]